jgi:hypothetical protein
MGRLEAPGLTADWLNGWLAAVGITVLLPDVRLAWTEGPLPHAVFTSTDHPPEAIPRMVAEALPTPAEAAAFVFAEEHPSAARRLAHKPDAETYRERAALSRAQGDWHLASLYTDLAPSRDSAIAPSPFNVGMPKGRTFHYRLLRCVEEVEERAGLVEASLGGYARRVRIYGLGFDYRRLDGAVSVAGGGVDPVVELAAAYGMSLLPVRGDGRVAYPRGWSSRPSRTLTWPAWAPFLDRWGIDALVDQVCAIGPRPAVLTRLGVTASYSSVAFRPLGAKDTTRAFASRRAL